VEPLIAALTEAGFDVQLRHIDTETSWEDVEAHGYVAIFDGERELLKRPGFQHNRKLRSGGSWDGDAVKKVIEEAIKAIDATPAA